ncbi:TRAP transporter small permease protein [Bordetella tumbae]|uniref:TRAP transporter small permease n=1 Tax=Bordetella tumbae TaxID=1649139 RepID=UPI0039F031D3
MHRFFDGLDRGLRMVVVALTLIMLFVLTLQVFSRYLLGQALSWSEEIALLGFAWIIAISTALVVRNGLHARMSLLPDSLPPAGRALVERIIALCVVGLGIALVRSGIDYMLETRGMLSAASEYPLELLHAVAPGFGILLTIFALERVVYGAGGQR